MRRRTAVMGTWNVRNIVEKEHERIKEMKLNTFRENQDKKSKGHGMKELRESYRLSWFGVDINSTGVEGVV